MYHFAPELIIRAWRIEKELVRCREQGCSGWLGHGRGHGGNQHNSPFLNGPSFTTFAASFSHPCCASALRGRTDGGGLGPRRVSGSRRTDVGRLFFNVHPQPPSSTSCPPPSRSQRRIWDQYQSQVELGSGFLVEVFPRGILK